MRLNLTETNAFQDKALPSETQLVGLSALVQALSVAAPVRRPSAVSEMHKLSKPRRGKVGDADEHLQVIFRRPPT
jgi:hypothetical protein